MGPGPAQNTVARRKNLIQLIHIGKSKLGLTDDEYRSFLEDICGKHSCADMTVRQLETALRSMRTAGFARDPLRVREDERGMATAAQLEYIKGMWARAARVKTDGALAAFIRRIAHVDDIRFLDPQSAQAVILALRNMMVKAGRDPDTSELRGPPEGRDG
jgi:hypothetical protein